VKAGFAIGQLAAALLVAAPACADRNDFAIGYFTVTSTTARGISAELDTKGPVGENGRHSDGYTHWAIDWSFDLDPEDSVCKVGTVVVNLDILMTLPRWQPNADPDPALIARWNRYLAALRVHENGHRERAESAARDVRRTLTMERPARDCDTLRSRLNSRANALLDALRDRQAAYDQETVFGQKQGVIRP
jgi:predicted secreted Zn-dependent protease